MIGNVPSLRPIGCPKGVDPRTWRQAIEKRLNELLDQSMALITALDLMEADCDLEDGGDREPWLGWTDRGLAAGGDLTDRELDPADFEPWLASPENCGRQIGWAAGGYSDCEVDAIDDGVADWDALHESV